MRPFGLLLTAFSSLQLFTQTWQFTLILEPGGLAREPKISDKRYQRGCFQRCLVRCSSSFSCPPEALSSFSFFRFLIPGWTPYIYFFFPTCHTHTSWLFILQLCSLELGLSWGLTSRWGGEVFPGVSTRLNMVLISSSQADVKVRTQGLFIQESQWEKKEISLLAAPSREGATLPDWASSPGVLQEMLWELILV